MTRDEAIKEAVERLPPGSRCITALALSKRDGTRECLELEFEVPGEKSTAKVYVFCDKEPK